MRSFSCITASVPTILASLMATSAPAQECRLALVLALDVSGSVSNADDRLQREGLAAALLAPEVMRAFLADSAVALYAFEWSGDSYQLPLFPNWQLIRSGDDLLHIAAALTKSLESPARPHVDGTAIGAALVHAAAALAAAPDCVQQVVDVSGDGENNMGIEPRTVLDSALGGVIVNALVIDRPEQDPMIDARTAGNGPLKNWFEGAVLHGPGAFYIEIDTFDDYERAMTVKLLRELELPLVSGWTTTDVLG